MSFLRRRLRLRALAEAAAVVLAIGAIAVAVAEEGPRGSAPGPAAAPPGGAAGGPRERTSFLSRLIPPPAERVRGPRVPRSIEDLARRLPLERKVAQLFVWGFEGQDLTAPVFERLRTLDLGGILIRRENYLHPQQLAALAGEPKAIARQAGHVPPFVLASQEGAEFNSFPDLPPAGAPADFDTPAGAAGAAAQSAQSLRPLGIDVVLGPVIDVGAPDGGAVGPRAFSDDPVLVADYGVRAIGVYRAAGMMPVVEHFPGIGAAAQDPEEGPANVGLTAEELARRDLVPFRAAIERGRAPAVLVGHGLYAEADVVTPASLSRAFTTDLLRGTLGFRGIAVADDLSSPAITAVASIPDAAVDALNAGADMLLVSGPLADQEATYVAVLNAVRKHQIARRRIDEALLRILIQKRRFGLIVEEGEQAPAPGGQAPPAGAAP